MIGWLLKDVGWVLLLWPVGWSAAALALATESARLWVSWTEESIGVRAHTLAALLWLLGNAFWMSGELLFDEARAAAHNDRVSLKEAGASRIQQI